jgi:hypothetical protein
MANPGPRARRESLLCAQWNNKEAKLLLIVSLQRRRVWLCQPQIIGTKYLEKADSHRHAALQSLQDNATAA